MYFRMTLIAGFILLSTGISVAQELTVNAHRAAATLRSTPVHWTVSVMLKKAFRAKITKVGYCDEDNDDGAICARRGCACGPGYDFDCCTSCHIPPGNTHGECE